MKRITCCLVCVIICLASTLPDNDLFSKRIILNMLRLAKGQPQEKVYLHTDRDHYDAGEKIWLRAYLINAVTSRISDYSRFVYVELLSREDSVINRVKLALQDSVFAGYIPLTEKLPQGDYILRAYSYWMQNAGDDYIFRKKVRIVNPRDSKVRTEVAYERDGGGDNIARIRFFNSRNEAYDKVFVEYTQNGKMKIARTDEQGNIRIKLDTVNFSRNLLVKFKEEDPFSFERRLFLVNPKKDFDVSFFPEGGHLLPGNTQMVAFKAIGTNGLSCEVSGWLYDDTGERISYVKSLHKGMGGFDLQVEQGRRYYAVLSTADSIQKKFDLPVPESRALGLKVLMNKDMLGYVVMAGDSARVPEDLHLLVHNHGVPLYSMPVGQDIKGKLTLENVPEGILHFLLIDGKSEVYSQRLCFIRKENRPEITLRTDKPYYVIRDRVNLDIQMKTDSLCDLSGSFSISVTDDSKCGRDSTSDNIISELLLTSDLKGYIEDPGYYFRDKRITTKRFLDLLMLTQGWTRFNIPDVIQGKYNALPYYMERGQAISGKVKKFWGKNANEAQLIAISTSGIVRFVQADSTGRFVIDGISFPDSTSFVIQGKSSKGRRNVEVVMDKDNFLSPSVRIPFDERTLAKDDDFYKKFGHDYYYDNGIKVYVLDEAVVKRKVAPKVYSFYDHMADYNLDSAKLASMGGWDIRMVFQELPGVEYFGDSVTRFGKTLYVLVNDFEEDMNYISMLQARDLVSISLMTPPRSSVMFGEKANNGALIITTNPNFVPRERPRLNMSVLSLLGYQKKAEFYMPHYEVDSVRLALADTLDQRVTVYWNPGIRTDSTGKASCFFNTSDSGGPYSVIIEGILNDGTICRKEEKIELKSR